MAQKDLSLVEPFTGTNIPETGQMPSASFPASPHPVSPNAVMLTQTDASGRNRMFDELVANDDDLIGLVAYALYKQSKRDWLHAFENDKGRAPSQEEINSYIIGECTHRRIETYRRLGADALVRLRPQTSTPMGYGNGTSNEGSQTASLARPQSMDDSAKGGFLSSSLGRQIIVISVGIIAGIVLIRYGLSYLFR
jgi:hypothetical protein